MMTKELNFTTWKNKRDGILYQNFNLKAEDLPDLDWLSLWNEGLDPQQAIQIAIDEVWYNLYFTLDSKVA
jgi:hypothetical protein